MATKKIPSVEDALNYFKDVMRRSSLENYVFVNRIALSKNPKGQSVIIVPDETLWCKIIDDSDLKDRFRELNPTDSADSNTMKLITYGEDLTNDWFEINPEEIFTGEIFKLILDGFDYDIPLSKNMLPLKLRKAEFNNIAYRVFTSPITVLALKKKFESPVEGCNFTMIRILQIL